MFRDDEILYCMYNKQFNYRSFSREISKWVMDFISPFLGKYDVIKLLWMVGLWFWLVKFEWNVGTADRLHTIDTISVQIDYVNKVKKNNYKVNYELNHNRLQNYLNLSVTFLAINFWLKRYCSCIFQVIKISRSLKLASSNAHFYQKFVCLGTICPIKILLFNTQFRYFFTLVIFSYIQKFTYKKK